MWLFSRSKPNEKPTLRDKVEEAVTDVLIQEVYRDRVAQIEQRESELSKREKAIHIREARLSEIEGEVQRSLLEIEQHRAQLEEEYHQNLRMANNNVTSDFYKKALRAEGQLACIQWLLQREQS